MKVTVSEAFRRSSSIYPAMMIVVEFDHTPQHTTEQEIRAVFERVPHVSVFCNNPIRGNSPRASVFNPVVIGHFEVWQLIIDDASPALNITRDLVHSIARAIAAKG